MQSAPGRSDVYVIFHVSAWKYVFYSIYLSLHIDVPSYLVLLKMKSVDIPS